MGYPTQIKGYKLWDSTLRKQVVSHDAVFCKPQFSYTANVEVSADEYNVINRGGDALEPIKDMGVQVTPPESTKTDEDEHNNESSCFPWEVPKDVSNGMIEKKISSESSSQASQPLGKLNRKTSVPKFYEASFFSFYAHAVPTSYKMLQILMNMVWKPAIDREHE